MKINKKIIITFSIFLLSFSITNANVIEWLDYSHINEQIEYENTSTWQVINYNNQLIQINKQMTQMLYLQTMFLLFFLIFFFYTLYNDMLWKK